MQTRGQSGCNTALARATFGVSASDGGDMPPATGGKPPETVMAMTRQAPKRLLVYRAATAFRGRKRHPLEVLARGQQFVAYAIHPVTGQPYAWPEDGLTKHGWIHVKDGRLIFGISAEVVRIVSQHQPEVGATPAIECFIGRADSGGIGIFGAGIT